MNQEIIANTATSIGISDLTHQETNFVHSILRGFPPVIAAKNAGFTQDEAPLVLARPHVAQTIAYLREQGMVAQAEVTRDTITGMFFEAYAYAATSTEMVGAARELGKLHGLYAPQQREVQVTTNNASEQQMKEMSSDKLAELAGADADAIDAEWTEIADDD